MIKRTLYRAAAATVLGLSLTTGIVAADTSSIDTTGKNSDNNITTKATDNSQMTTTTHVNAHVDNDQMAHTGNASSSGNTKGSGMTQTGDASNDSTVHATVAVTSPSAGSGGGSSSVFPSSANGSISTTGENSQNNVTSTYTDNSKVKTTTTINASVDNDQNATSGNATVNGNTVGGGAMTGKASNTSSITFDLSSGS